MPSPTPLAWYGHHLPPFILRAMLYFMFVAEVVAPARASSRARLRLVSFALLTCLMLGIQATGNWGYFNLGYIALVLRVCSTRRRRIFDLGQEPWRSSLWSFPSRAINAVLLVMFLTSLLYLVVLDSWTPRTLVHWPLDRLHLEPALAARACSPTCARSRRLRIVNGYGVFPPNSVPPLRIIPVFEGSDDGVTWKAYRYRHMPRARTSAPHIRRPLPSAHRHGAVYSAACVYDASFYGRCSATARLTRPMRARLGSTGCASALLDGDPLFLRLLADNPFPDAPPKFVRVSIVRADPGQSARCAARRARGGTRGASGRGRAGARQEPSWPRRARLPEPEVFHPDWVDYKRRSAPLARHDQRRIRKRRPPDEAVLSRSDLTAEDVRRFWEEFVPLCATRPAATSRAHGAREALEERFGKLHDRTLRARAGALRVAPAAQDRAPPIRQASSPSSRSTATSATTCSCRRWCSTGRRTTKPS